MAGLSINEVTTYRWSFEEDVTGYLEAGIEAIGVWRRKLTDYGEEKGIELVRHTGIKVSNLLWAGGFTGSDGRSYQESLADARDALQLAAELEAPCLVVYSGGRNGHTQNHARRLFAGALAELLPVAERLGVTLAVEPMHSGCADEWTLLTSLDEAMGLVDGIGCPRLKLAFDTYHLGHDPRVVDEIARVARHVAVVHLADGRQPPVRDQNRHPLGDGTLPVAAIVRSFQQAGYNGYYDVELVGEAVERCDYQELLTSSKRTFERLASAGP